MTIKVEKLKNHNRISNQGPFCGLFNSHAINKGVSRDVDRVGPISVQDGMVRGTLADRKAKLRSGDKDRSSWRRSKMKNDILT